MASGALSIKLRCASWHQLATIYKRDLSRGTMFLKASTPPSIGTAVRIDLMLPSHSVVVLTGIVHCHVDDARGRGVELKLAPIPTGSVWLIESALASEHRRQPTPAAGVSTDPIAAIGDGAELSVAESELIRALNSEAESLRRLDPFLVLGVGYDANDDVVRTAFGELTKRYHPDRFARYESVELRQVAAEIFMLIRDAYRRIGDAPSRGPVLASLGRAAPRAVPAPRLAPGPLERAPQVIPVRPRSPHPAPNPAASPAASPASPAIERRTIERAASPRATPEPADPIDATDVEDLIDDGRLDEALAAYKVLAKNHPQDRTLRAGIELCEGLRSLGQRDRLEAAQRFETALEIDPSNERAARELADMRRQATNERKGLLSRLMGKHREP